jgi:hypothetical protein
VNQNLLFCVLTDVYYPVALAWALQKYPYVFPIVGGRKIEHLEDNVKALTVELSNEQIAEIESVVPLTMGFPMEIFGIQPGVNGQVNRLLVSKSRLRMNEGG